MAKGTKICKVCGKEYEYCHTLRSTDIFRWQDVACCPEHASEYFARVAAARAAKNDNIDVGPVDGKEAVGGVDKKKTRKRDKADKKL